MPNCFLYFLFLIIKDCWLRREVAVIGCGYEHGASFFDFAASSSRRSRVMASNGCVHTIICFLGFVFSGSPGSAYKFIIVCFGRSTTTIKKLVICKGEGDPSACVVMCIAETLSMDGNKSTMSAHSWVALHSLACSFFL